MNEVKVNQLIEAATNEAREIITGYAMQADDEKEMETVLTTTAFNLLTGACAVINYNRDKGISPQEVEKTLMYMIKRLKGAVEVSKPMVIQ